MCVILRVRLASGGKQDMRMSRTRRVTTRARGSAGRVYSENTVVEVEYATEEQRIGEYNRMMQERMGWDTLDPFSYHPERGLYYHYITTDLVVGSQPQTPDDIKYLSEEEDVAVILSLQQEKDLEYWGVNGADLLEAADTHGVKYIKVGAVDFDPHSLRGILPKAVAALERARQEHGKAYVHCTAGLGRAPAVAIASLFWNTDMNLDEAYEYLTRIRPCGPNADAIRGATFDILDHRAWDEFQHLPQDAFRYLSEFDRQVIRQRIFEHFN